MSAYKNGLNMNEERPEFLDKESELQWSTQHNSIEQQDTPVNKEEHSTSPRREVLRVTSKSDPKSVAGAVAAILRNGETVEIYAIGAAAVNQVIKLLAVARGYVAPNGIDMIFIPAFSQIEVDGKEKTCIKFFVEGR